METGQPSYPESSGMSAGAMTGQPSYPESSGMSAGAMYQDPNTIQRQAAPTTGDLYAQPDKPARHQQKQQAMELPTYQDPNTIQRQAAPSGDMYALPEKIPKQPLGPAPALYTEVHNTNQVSTLFLYSTSHSQYELESMCTVHVLQQNVHKYWKISGPRIRILSVSPHTCSQKYLLPYIEMMNLLILVTLPPVSEKGLHLPYKVKSDCVSYANFPCTM